MQLRKKEFQSQPQQIVILNSDRTHTESSTDDYLHQYELGSTPPRTRIKNKKKTWEQKQQQQQT